MALSLSRLSCCSRRICISTNRLTLLLWHAEESLTRTSVALSSFLMVLSRSFLSRSSCFFSSLLNFSSSACRGGDRKRIFYFFSNVLLYSMFPNAFDAMIFSGQRNSCRILFLGAVQRISLSDSVCCSKTILLH